MNTRIFTEERIRGLMGTPLVKVVTGMRRTGKTFFLRRLQNILQNEKGVPPENIFFMNKEDLAFDAITTYTEAHNAITTAFQKVSGKKYIFIDEVQEIKEWEKVVRHYGGQEEYEVFITGSNASLLSGELASVLTGRFVEIPIFSLTFHEFLLFRGEKQGPREEEFSLFLRYGGLPGIHTMELSDDNVRSYLSGVFHSIVFRDIVERFEVRQTSLLKNILYYIVENIGNIVSSKKISSFLENEKIKLSMATVREYLDFFQNAFLLRKVKRYDLKGKKVLELYEKYYVEDIGIRSLFLGFEERDTGRLLENIVFLELQARGYTISIGKRYNTEIDFLAEKNGEKQLIQVAYSLTDPATKERELRPLLQEKSPFLKLILSMSRFEGDYIEGIRHKYLLDWLLEEK